MIGGSARLLVSVALVGLLGACGGGAGSGTAAPAKTTSSDAAPAAPSGASSAAAKPSGTASLTPLKYGVPVASVNSLDIYVGDQRGFFREQGLDLEIITVGPSSQAVQAQVSGSVDIGGPATDATINAVEKGADLVLIAGQLNRAVYSLIVGKDVREYADLRGKTMAVSDLRDGSTTLLRRLLQRGGLGLTEVDLVPVGGTPNRAAALTSGQAAGTMLAQPQDFRMMADGYPRLGLSTEAVPDFLFQAETARRGWLRDNGDTAVRFLRAIIASHRFMHEPTNREAVTAILAEATKSGPEESAQTYDLVFIREPAFPREGELNVEALRNVIAVLGENGILEAPLPAPEKYLDLSYLDRAKR